MRQENFWPTAQQEMLLDAALRDGDAAIGAWRRWLMDGENSEFDVGSQRLAPLVYFNLSRLGVKHPLLDKFKGLYRYTWYRNQCLSRRFVSVLDRFEARGIPAMTVKGVPLSLAVYRDMGLRPMTDIDLVVPHEYAPQALALLAQDDWRTALPPQRQRPERAAAVEFRARDGAVLDLHFSLFHESTQWSHTAPFWEAPRILQIGPARILMPCPADQLLHTITHGMRSDPVPPIRWIADAVWIMRGPDPIDWERLLKQADAVGLMLVVERSLRYLAARHGGVPGEILRKAASHRPRIFERMEYYLGRKRRIPIVDLGIYVRKYPERSRLGLILGFLDYLQKRLEAPSVLAAIGLLLQRVVRFSWRECRFATGHYAVPKHRDEWDQGN